MMRWSLDFARFLLRTLARFIRGPAAHESDGQKLIELGHRAERGDARIEVGAGTEIDEFLPSSIQCAIVTKSECRDRW